ncbi:MAG: aminotransferase class V-fold PLP-dependent enzyme [Candidatus Thorarchaeota archaeon]|nr:aminotransferase class V-fold PLP-dependent enzyme [Candidatus Thorarchaeota archaeon]
MTAKLDIKSDFGVFEKIPDLVYLDSASTTLVPRTSIQATTYFLDKIVSSARKGAHKLAIQGSTIVENTRKSLSQFLEAEPASLSFQKSIPSSIASLIYGYDWKQKKKDRIAISQGEENSVLVSLLRSAEVLNIEVDIVPIEDDGAVSLSSLEDMVNERTGIVAVSHIVPGIGTRNPVSKIAEVVHSHDALLLTDATRSVGITEKSPIHLDCDILVFSANIGLMAPPGLTVQWINPSIERNHIPGILGGSSVSNVVGKSYEIALQPDKFESGYINVPAIAGLGASINYLTNLHANGMTKYITQLVNYMRQRLEEIDTLTLYGRPNNETTIVGFNLGDSSEIGCHDIALFLDESNIAVRSGLICAHPLIQSISLDGLIQASVHAYNSIEDIDRLTDTLTIISKDLM